MMRTDSAGGALLIRFAARRERIAAPLAVVALPLLVVVTGASMAALYADPASRSALRSGAASNAAFRLLVGPLGDDTSTAAITNWRVGLFLLLVAAILVALTITRNSRAQEDTGVLELVRAGAVGSLAPLLGAVAVAAAVSVAIGVAMAAGTAIVGAPMVAVGAVGVQFAAVCLAAVGVASVTNQAFATARGATTAAVTVLVGGYVLRGVGDLADGFAWLRWLSPMGWGQLMDPFGARDLLPALLCLLLFAVGVGASATVARRRDLGQGVLATRAGPSGSAHPGPVEALTARVALPTVAPWAGAATAYCLLLGFLLDSVDDLVPSGGGVTTIVRDLGGAGSIAQSVMNAVLGFVGAIAAMAAVAVVARTRADETAGRTEQVLATAVTRTRYHLATAVAALGASVIVIAGATIGILVGHTISAGTTAAPGVPTVLAAGAVQVPGTLAVASVAIAAYGWGPRWVPLGWAAVVADLLLAQFGTLFDLPMWIRDIAPHTHVVAQDPGAIGVWPLVIPLGVAVGLIALGGWGFRRRGIPG